jgi:hypothetical protein
VAGAILDRREPEHHADFMTFMRFGSPGGVRQFIGEDYAAAPMPAQAQAVPAESRQALGELRRIRPRAHRCNSSAAQINLSGAALTALLNWASAQPSKAVGHRPVSLLKRYVTSDLVAQGLARELKAHDFSNQVRLFGAGLLVSLLPFFILLSAFPSGRVGNDAALCLGQDRQAPGIVTHLFTCSPGHSLISPAR